MPARNSCSLLNKRFYKGHCPGLKRHLVLCQESENAPKLHFPYSRTVLQPYLWKQDFGNFLWQGSAHSQIPPSVFSARETNQFVWHLLASKEENTAFQEWVEL